MACLLRNIARQKAVQQWIYNKRDDDENDVMPRLQRMLWPQLSGLSRALPGRRSLVFELLTPDHNAFTVAQANICGPAWAYAQAIADLNYAFYYGTAEHIRMTLAFAIKTWRFNMHVQQQTKSSLNTLDADDTDDDTDGSSEDALNTRRHSSVLLGVSSAQDHGSSFSSWFCSNFSHDAKLTDAVQAR